MEFNLKNNQYITENTVTSIIQDIIKSPQKFKNAMKQGFQKFIKILQDNDLETPFLKILNKQFKTNYKSLKQLQNLKEDTIVNEDFKNFLRFWRGETYPALSIFPTLQIWFQIDRLLDGVSITNLDWKRISVYGVMWIIIITGQHVILHKKWKKENPDEYESEGNPGIFRRGKQKNDNSMRSLEKKYPFLKRQAD